MLKFSRFSLLSILLIASTAVLAADADKPVALVNGAAIPQSRIDLRLKAATQQGQPDSPELRNALREDLINLEIISQEATKQGLEKQAETAQQLELARQSVLASAFVQDYVKTHPLDEALLKQDYEAMKARIGDKEFKVSHILVPTEDEAKALAKRVKKESFSKVASRNHKIPAQKTRGVIWAGPYLPTLYNPSVRPLSLCRKARSARRFKPSTVGMSSNWKIRVN